MNIIYSDFSFEKEGYSLTGQYVEIGYRYGFDAEGNCISWERLRNEQVIAFTINPCYDHRQHSKGFLCKNKRRGVGARQRLLFFGGLPANPQKTAHFAFGGINILGRPLSPPIYPVCIQTAAHCRK